MMKKRSSGHPIAETMRRWMRAPSKFPPGTTVHALPFLNDRSSRYRTVYAPDKSHSASHTKGPAAVDFRTCMKSESCLWSSITASVPGSTSISSSITHIQSNPDSYAHRIPSRNPPAPPTLRPRFSVHRDLRSYLDIVIPHPHPNKSRLIRPPHSVPKPTCPTNIAVQIQRPDPRKLLRQHFSRAIGARVLHNEHAAI